MSRTRSVAGRAAWPVLSIVLLCLSPTCGADVGPDDEIYSPMVEAGEAELEARYYHLDGNRHGDNHAREYRLELGYSPTGFWRASVSPVIVDGFDSVARLAQVQIENVFQLTPAGNPWVDLGLFLSYEIATVDDADDELVVGPVFERRLGTLTLRANVFVDRAITSAPDIGLSYGWQASWPAGKRIAFGVQGFGEREFADEEDDDATAAYAPGDRLGPALFGTIPVDDEASLNLQLGLLWGLGHAAADHTLRLAIAYER
ncbi:hypothetical protein [Salinisphaera sp. T31B1]|uniref:hypothetical protein n=1 Tax=Salinisphaera sp. T31B1 TaxID=727963 RepID=UPI00334051ED